MFIKQNSQGFATFAIVLAVTTLLLLGAGAYYFMEQQSANSIEQPAQIVASPSSETVAADNTSPENLAALFASTDIITCTYTDASSPTQQSSGEVFISGENMRGTFTFTDDSGTTTSHVIRSGNTGYLWNSDTNEGFMMEIQDPEELFETFSQNTESTEEPNYETDSDIAISCKPWNEDASLFVPPSSVNFVSVTQQLEQNQNISGEADEGSNQDLCESCAQIPDPTAQSQCLQALGC
ncbi:MAG: hypothetical protein WAU07_03315 [Microgenomates group bacterium]